MATHTHTRTHTYTHASNECSICGTKETSQENDEEVKAFRCKDHSQVINERPDSTSLITWVAFDKSEPKTEKKRLSQKLCWTNFIGFRMHIGSETARQFTAGALKLNDQTRTHNALVKNLVLLWYFDKRCLPCVWRSKEEEEFSYVKCLCHSGSTSFCFDHRLFVN